MSESNITYENEQVRLVCEETLNSIRNLLVQFRETIDERINIDKLIKEYFPLGNIFSDIFKNFESKVILTKDIPHICSFVLRINDFSKFLLEDVPPIINQIFNYISDNIPDEMSEILNLHQLTMSNLDVHLNCLTISTTVVQLHNHVKNHLELINSQINHPDKFLLTLEGLTIHLNGEEITRGSIGQALTEIFPNLIKFGNIDNKEPEYSEYISH